MTPCGGEDVGEALWGQRGTDGGAGKPWATLRPRLSRQERARRWALAEGAGKWCLSRTRVWGGRQGTAHRVHLGGRPDVVLSGLWGLGLGTAALGIASHVIQLPVLGSSVDLSHLGRGQAGTS